MQHESTQLLERKTERAAESGMNSPFNYMQTG